MLGSVQVLYKQVFLNSRPHPQKCLYCIHNISISGHILDPPPPKRAYIILEHTLTSKCISTPAFCPSIPPSLASALVPCAPLQSASQMTHTLSLAALVVSRQPWISSAIMLGDTNYDLMLRKPRLWLPAQNMTYPSTKTPVLGLSTERWSGWWIPMNTLVYRSQVVMKSS